jgi:hypothetical protein
MEDVCEVCGNERLANVPICRFCGIRYENEAAAQPGGPIHRVVNIEHGRPIVEEALNKLGSEIERACNDGIAVLTVIHGYGSSGRGGVIRQECRRILTYWESKGKIKDFVVGERFAKKEGRTRALLRRFPELINNDNLNKGNRGVTLVVIK